MYKRTNNINNGKQQSDIVFTVVVVAADVDDDDGDDDYNNFSPYLMLGLFLFYGGAESSVEFIQLLFLSVMSLKAHIHTLIHINS